MRRSLLLIVALVSGVLPALRAQNTHVFEPVVEETPVAAPPEPGFDAIDAITLGLVEGVTEFLPISSTGHLIIASHALHLESKTALIGPDGQILWHKPPSKENPIGEALTMKLAVDAFTVVVQIGAIFAVVLIYWAQLMGILRGLMGKNAAGIRLLRNILLAFLPCAVSGYLLHHWIDRHLFSVPAVIVALISGAVLMLAAERWRRHQSPMSTPRIEPSDLSAKQALGIGLMQCLALWPGTSRSMVTIVGGYFSGLSPAKAAEFSFLVGLPTLAGAAVLKGVTEGRSMVAVLGWEHILIGTSVAAISAALTVKFLVRYLSRHGLGVFAIYRLLLAAGLAAWFFS